mmetsp:Transcript_20454/g.32114  ORF Transcript_20454/g.32114 Transcript_20454/m.32114 type:complete len:278 (-) Transcript_20454:156-989(-)
MAGSVGHVRRRLCAFVHRCHHACVHWCLSAGVHGRGGGEEGRRGHVVPAGRGGPPRRAQAAPLVAHHLDVLAAHGDLLRLGVHLHLHVRVRRVDHRAQVALERALGDLDALGDHLVAHAPTVAHSGGPPRRRLVRGGRRGGVLGEGGRQQVLGLRRGRARQRAAARSHHEHPRVLGVVLGVHEEHGAVHVLDGGRPPRVLALQHVHHVPAPELRLPGVQRHGPPRDVVPLPPQLLRPAGARRPRVGQHPQILAPDVHDHAHLRVPQLHQVVQLVPPQ